MSTLNFSNFIAKFTDSSNIDIVSSVPNEVSLASLPSITPQVSGRYFCIGDLLIQFNTNSIPNNQNTGSYQLDFPISYDDTPYTVMLTGTRQNNNDQVITTLNSFTTSRFTFSIKNNNGWVNFIAIGPRPSSLYTSSS